MKTKPSNLIRLPSRGPREWQSYLAEPAKQWKPDFSAWAVAHSWEAAQDFPVEIRRMFQSYGAPFKQIEPLIIVAEHGVPLPFGVTESQNDIFIVAKAEGQLVSITVEGKKEEPFDKPVEKWLKTKSPRSNKPKRLEFLLQTIGLSQTPVSKIDSIYYQLLHRTASAVLEAKRFNASTAVMLVHSFSPTNLWFSEAFVPFCKLFGAQPELGGLVSLGSASGIPLFTGWAKGNPKFLSPAVHSAQNQVGI